MRKKRPLNLERWLVPRLRRISMHWPEISKAKSKARVYVQVGKYKNGNPLIKRYFLCQAEDCGCLCEENEGAVDHINPVVEPTEGFTNIGEYILALFCNSDNLQFLCHTCHDLKTAAEDLIRNNKNKA